MSQICFILNDHSPSEDGAFDDWLGMRQWAAQGWTGKVLDASVHSPTEDGSFDNGQRDSSNRDLRMAQEVVMDLLP